MSNIIAPPDPSLNKFKTKPYRHQLDCLNRFGRKQVFALLAEQGTGKTYIIINNIADLWDSDECDVALIMAPNGVHENWTRIELPKHMPDRVQYIAAPWYADPKKADRDQLNALFQHDNRRALRMMTMNWEALQTPRGLAAAEKFLCTGRRVMIACDESDAVKNPSAIRTTNLMKLKKYSYWRRIMTGTPVNNAPFDLFSQYGFLDENILGTTSYWAFKAEYAEMLHDGHPLLKAIKREKGLRRTPQIVARTSQGLPRYRNLDKLSRLIDPYSFRVLKKDCLDLPEKIYKTLVFELTHEQKIAYRRAAEELRIEYNGVMTPFTALVAGTKLSQITSGYYLHPAAEEPVRIPGANPKLDMLEDRVKWIVSTGEKVIIWARYRVQIADIVERLTKAKLKCVEYHGGVNKGDRVDAIDEFENGDAQVFIGNQQAGGRGLTLVAASYVCYFSNDFSLRNRLQSEDRAHRIGQTKNVIYMDFIGKNSVDESAVRALQNKEDVANAILSHVGGGSRAQLF